MSICMLGYAGLDANIAMAPIDNVADQRRQHVRNLYKDAVVDIRATTSFFAENASPSPSMDAAKVVIESLVRRAMVMSKDDPEEAAYLLRSLKSRLYKHMKTTHLRFALFEMWHGSSFYIMSKNERKKAKELRAEELNADVLACVMIQTIKALECDGSVAKQEPNSGLVLLERLKGFIGAKHGVLKRFLPKKSEKVVRGLKDQPEECWPRLNLESAPVSSGVSEVEVSNPETGQKI